MVVGSPKSPKCPRVMAYGETEQQACAKVLVLALNVIAARPDAGEA